MAIQDSRNSTTQHVKKLGQITEVAGWAYARRGFFDEWELHKSPKAKQALDRRGTEDGAERPDWL